MEKYNMLIKFILNKVYKYTIRKNVRMKIKDCVKKQLGK